MVPAEKIIETLRAEQPDILCLSGLITPSLEEMTHVAGEMQKAGMTIPILTGGATTSKLYTALRIAPHYDYPVIHAADASQSPLIAARLLHPENREKYIIELRDEYEQIRNLHLASEKKETPLPWLEARKHPFRYDWSSYTPVKPRRTGVNRLTLPVNELLPYINWAFFFSAWKLGVRYGNPATLQEYRGCRDEWINKFPEKERAKAGEALKLYCDARHLLDETRRCHYRAVYGIFHAVAAGEDIYVDPSQDGNTHTRITIPLLRQQTPGENGLCLSLADWLMPLSEGKTDFLGFFAVTAGEEADALKYAYREDAYKLMLLQTLLDRLAEAAAEYLHEKVRKEYWGYAPDEDLPPEELFRARYRGIRPAAGFPSLPDQNVIFLMDKLLDLRREGISITASGAMSPASSIAGMYFAHPDARYFMIGKITEEQLDQYAARSGNSKEYLRKFLLKNLDSQIYT
jgi:5-methyltetrahydrofolate--homocysteine methyltransferase